jgi:hypothetical protein
MVCTITLVPLWAADEDLCSETGLYIKNGTTIDLWYTLDDGPCTFWAHDHILILKPGERLVIYRDMTCKIEYCSKTPTYADYLSFDADRNCRVQLFPDCTLADM